MEISRLESTTKMGSNMEETEEEKQRKESVNLSYNNRNDLI